MWNDTMSVLRKREWKRKNGSEIAAAHNCDGRPIISINGFRYNINDTGCPFSLLGWNSLSAWNQLNVLIVPQCWIHSVPFCRTPEI